jgi:hypothetical protein
MADLFWSSEIKAGEGGEGDDGGDGGGMSDDEGCIIGDGVAVSGGGGGGGDGRGDCDGVSADDGYGGRAREGGDDGPPVPPALPSSLYDGVVGLGNYGDHVAIQLQGSGRCWEVLAFALRRYLAGLLSLTVIVVMCTCGDVYVIP